MSSGIGSPLSVMASHVRSSTESGADALDHFLRRSPAPALPARSQPSNRISLSSQSPASNEPPGRPPLGSLGPSTPPPDSSVPEPQTIGVTTPDLSPSSTRLVPTRARTDSGEEGQDQDHQPSRLRLPDLLDVYRQHPSLLRSPPATVTPLGNEPLSDARCCPPPGDRLRRHVPRRGVHDQRTGDLHIDRELQDDRRRPAASVATPPGSGRRPARVRPLSRVVSTPYRVTAHVALAR
jgi:hypothetical protein